MRRRRVLEGLVTGVAAGVAGCSTPSIMKGNTTTLGKIKIINFSKVHNQIRIIVVRDDETVLDNKFELGPYGAGMDASTEIIKPRWPMSSGEYTLKAHHYDSDGERETSGSEYTFTKEDYDTYYEDEVADPGCIGAIIVIGSGASEPNGTIGISPTKIENPCGDGEEPH